jgi:type I restriction enzyme S subunit
MQEIDAGLAKSAALRQSILQQAFSGQLVAQDLNDEPASVLLERIKAEKAEQNKDNKNNKRRDAA